MKAPEQAAGDATEVAFSDLLFRWHGWGLELRVGLLWALLTILVLAIAWFWTPRVRRRFFGKYRTKSIKLTFKGVEWDICPDHETRRVAHQAWVEIKSRKVGLPFEDDDVIVEVYSSWYQLFGVLRELAKSIPADRLHDCDDTRKLVELLLRALNQGLRPHLTKWQARFRRWYAIEEKKGDQQQHTPQELQRQYPEYQALVADLRAVSTEFVQFADSLHQIAQSP